MNEANVIALLPFPDEDDAEEVSVIRRSVLPHKATRESSSSTRIEIDLDAIASNARAVKRAAGDAGVLAMLKADAYGHGLVPVAQAIAREVSGFVVTSVRDGLALRHANVNALTLVMTPTWGDRHADVIRANLVPVITSIADLEAFARLRTPARVHVKLDTGMARLGVREDEITPILMALARHSQIMVDGLCTHLSSADSDDRATTERQLDAFERGLLRFRGAGHRPTVLHVANSCATYRHPRAHFNHVRTGIALFGGDEFTTDTTNPLTPALRLVTHVAQVRSIAKGESVSYGETWQAHRDSRIATLPIGYAHGYPRRLSGRRADVLIRGRRCPVVGMICMEMILVDVTDVPEIDINDEVVLIGDAIRATDLATASGAIVEEIFCGLSKDVLREHNTNSTSSVWFR